MSKQSKMTVPTQNWKPRALVIGGIIGAVVGVAAVYILIQRSNDDRPPQISARQGAKMGTLILRLLRNIADLT